MGEDQILCDPAATFGDIQGERVRCALDQPIPMRGDSIVFQQTLVVGRVGRDAEMRYTPGGIPVTNFSVAVDRRWTDANGQTLEKVTWFRIVCWRKLAEVTAQYVKKGQRILVAGDIEASAWTDRDGTPRASLELTADRVRFLSDREAGDEAKAPPETGPDADKEADAGDELPF